MSNTATALFARNAYALAGAAVVAQLLGCNVVSMGLMIDSAGRGRLSTDSPIAPAARNALAAAGDTAPALFVPELAAQVDNLDDGNLAFTLADLPDADGEDDSDPSVFYTSSRTVGGALPDVEAVLMPNAAAIDSLARQLISDRIIGGQDFETAGPIDLSDGEGDDAGDSGQDETGELEDLDDDDASLVALSQKELVSAIVNADNLKLARLAAGSNPKIARLATLQIEARAWRPGDDNSAGATATA